MSRGAVYVAALLLITLILASIVAYSGVPTEPIKHKRVVVIEKRHDEHRVVVEKGGAIRIFESRPGRRAEQIPYPPHGIVNSTSGIYILFLDSSFVEVNSTATLNVVALSGTGPVSGKSFVATLSYSCWEEPFAENYTGTTGSYGLARIVVKAPSCVSPAGIDLVQYDPIGSSTRTVETVGLESYRIAYVGAILEGGAEVRDGANITLYATTFSGAPFNGTINVTVHLYGSDYSQSYNTSLDFSNGVTHLYVDLPQPGKYYLSIEAMYPENPWFTRWLVEGMELCSHVAYTVIPIDYASYVTTEENLSIPVVVFDTRLRAIPSGVLRYNIYLEYDNGTWTSYIDMNTTITNGIATILLNVTGVRNVDVHLISVEVGNETYCMRGDRSIYVESYEIAPPTTATTAPTPPPLDISVYVSTYPEPKLVAHVTRNGEPAPGLTVYFYLPWNDTEVLNATTDEQGLAAVPIGDILAEHLKDPRNIYAMIRGVPVLAVVSDGEYAAYDFTELESWIIDNVLGFPISSEEVSAGVYRVSINENYTAKLPVYLEHEMPLCYSSNYTSFIALLRGGESVEFSAPRGFYGWVFASVRLGWAGWGESLWRAELPGYIEIKRIGSTQCTSMWCDWEASIGSPIEVEGAVYSGDEPVANASVLGVMNYRESDGVVALVVKSNSSGWFEIAFPASESASEAVLALVGILPSGYVVGDRYGNLPRFYGEIRAATATTPTTPPPTTTITTTTTATPSPTTASPVTTTAATTAPPTTPVPATPALVGGTLEFVEPGGMSSTIPAAAAFTAIAVAAALLLLARRRV